MFPVAIGIVSVCALSAFASVAIGRVTTASLTIASVCVAFAMIGVWFTYRPSTITTARRVKAYFDAIKRVREEKRREKLAATERLLAEQREQNRRLLAERKRKEEERLEALRRDAIRREQAEKKRHAELARAMRPVDVKWTSVNGVDASAAITYGVDQQYVYCYTFPTWLEIARLKGEKDYRVKVGMASKHPIDRIRDQIKASKTAIAEGAKVLLVFQTHDCSKLERWLHQRLPRAENAQGREWFTTNPDALIELFRTYLADYLRTKQFDP